MKALLTALPAALILLCLAGFGILRAATPGNGVLVPPTTSGGTSSVSWTGGPYTAVTADPSLCTPAGCDNFSLLVDVPASFYSGNPGYTVQVAITWGSNTNDFDLYVYDSTGTLVNSSAQGGTTSERVDLGQLTGGTYRVQVVAFTTVNATYGGTATLGPVPVDVRNAKYKKGNFAFTTPLRLAAGSDLLFGAQDLEPRSAFDAQGNIYVAAIQGIPVGTDVWKSTDNGSSFAYLGEPDGAQAGALLARGGGAGGGDEDITVTHGGRVVVTSLWIGSVTTCVSTNGGALWLVNPLSTTVPLDDRQWIASYGENIVYLTFKQLGVLLSGTSSVFVLKSTDGGLTFPQVTEATTPAFGVQPGFQGNIEVDQRNGNVFTVFLSSDLTSIYVARSSNGGTSFDLVQVHHDAGGASLGNVFPILAIDRSGGLHVVYSNGTNIYLTSSADAGSTWTVPVRVNNGTGTKSSLSPWVDAGDSGKVDVMWWGTSASSNLSTTAQWRVFFAQTLNAYASTPTISQTPATGIFHTGAICVNGTACASGTRNLAEYASLRLYRDGRAMIVNPDDQQTTDPQTYFIRQAGGTSILSSTATVISSVASKSVRRVSGTSGGETRLEQNHPNPFNPTTAIQYVLAGRQFVDLTIYNILGVVVTRLVHEVQDAGDHEVNFTAGTLPSGIYFSRLSTGGGKVLTRKLVLMK